MLYLCYFKNVLLGLIPRFIGTFSSVDNSLLELKLTKVLINDNITLLELKHREF